MKRIKKEYNALKKLLLAKAIIYNLINERVSNDSSINVLKMVKI